VFDASHTSYDDLVAVSNVIGYSEAIDPVTPLSNAAGYAEMNTVIFTSLISGFSTVELNTVSQICVFEDVADDIFQSVPIAFLDTAVGLPVLADGRGYTFSPDAGLYGALFRI